MLIIPHFLIIGTIYLVSVPLHKSLCSITLNDSLMKYFEFFQVFEVFSNEKEKHLKTSEENQSKSSIEDYFI